MSEPATHRRVVVRLVVEACAWGGASALFLALYAHHSSGGTEAIWPHLVLVGSLVGSLWLLRVAVWRWWPARLGPQWVCAALVTGAALLLLGYYALVIVGLGAWGRVVSHRLLSSYLGQLPELAQALGLPWAPLCAGMLAVLVGSWLLVGKFVARDDWARIVARRGGTRSLSLGLACGALAVVAQLYSFVAAPPTDRREPFSLTLFPELTGRTVQGHRMSGASEFKAKADEDRRDYRPSQDAQRPTVVLVVADALRADHLGVAGYRRDTTPYLSRLARTSGLWLAPRMSAVCAESSCGLMAIARSKYLHEFSDADLSLHEVLRLHGYKVHLILGGDHTNFYGLRQAYGTVDSYHDGSMGTGYFNDDVTVTDAMAAMPRSDGQPAMFQFHLMSAHPLGRRHPQAGDFRPAAPYHAWARGDASKVDDAARQSAQNYYDNGVRGVDDVLRQLLELLAQKGYLQDAIVILTGDHGEMLGEHGEFGHAKGVFESALQVPWLWMRFGQAPAPAAADPRVRLSQIDIAPTVLAALKMPVPRSWSGRAQVASPAGRAAVLFQQGDLFGAYEGTGRPGVLKYWRNLTSGEEHVFDLEADAAEKHDLLTQVAPDALSALRRATLPAVAMANGSR
jgi:glucan phosphoethanolaminetransferase (alkaline phosphatase superfamily)